MRTRIVILLTVALLALSIAPALAHQPFFEEQDITVEAPWRVKDPTVSTALYATLESAEDVDYYAFDGRKGQSILLEITIPQIAGQELFAPEMAVLGPGLGADATPARVTPPGLGVRLIPALTGPAKMFNEPYSRTSYWERQSQRVILPVDGRYVVAVWHGTGEVGRYVFVIGDKERQGGDPTFPLKIRDYWTPVPAPVSAPASAAAPASSHGCGGESLTRNK